MSARKSAPSSALQLLKAQHDEVDELFEAIDAAESASAKRELFIELADKLATS
jgi:hypothetical protein